MSMNMSYMTWTEKISHLHIAPVEPLLTASPSLLSLPLLPPSSLCAPAETTQKQTRSWPPSWRRARSIPEDASHATVMIDFRVRGSEYAD